MVGKFLFGLIFIFLVSFGSWHYYFSDKTIFTKGIIDFSSLEFSNGGLIPQSFTCDGKDISPSYSIERVPLDAKSLVIMVEDTDAPSLFTHYLLFNVDPQIGVINQSTTPDFSVVGTNDYGKQEYNGPCPPIGSHRYRFKVLALNKFLDLDETAKRSDIDKAVKGGIIAKGEFWGEYTKN